MYDALEQIEQYSINNIIHRMTPYNAPDECYESINFKELNGECVSYTKEELNKPIPWIKFIKLTHDIQKEYIIKLNKLYKIDILMLSSLFSYNADDIQDHIINDLKLPINKWCVRGSDEYEAFLKFIKLRNKKH